jgi:geranylgeranyl pyrophosphate synthase
MNKKTAVVNHDSQIERLQSLLRRYGSEAVEQAKKSVLDEPFEHEVVSSALRYFMCDYWKDYATPTLLLLSNEAVGGNSKSLANLAPALILVNGAIDIHDDVVDHSKQKDNRQTVYGKFGEEVALLIGDALFVKGLLMFAGSCRAFDVEKCGQIVGLLKQGLFELGEAEVFELGYRGAVAIKPSNYLKAMNKKAADVEALTRIGAILGNARRSEIDDLGNYGRIVGLLSILRDDVIDMTLQEELKHRLQYECLPLPIQYALQNAKVRGELLKLMKNGMKTKDDYMRICILTEHGYGFKKTMGSINELVRRGKALTTNLKNKRKELLLLLLSLADLSRYKTLNPT